MIYYKCNKDNKQTKGRSLKMNVVKKERIQPLDKVTDFLKTTTRFEELTYNLMKAVVLMEQKGTTNMRKVIENYITPATDENWKIGLKRNFENARLLFEEQDVELKLYEENEHYHIGISFKTTDKLDPDLLAGMLLQDIYKKKLFALGNVVHYDKLLMSDYTEYVNRVLKSNYQKAIDITLSELKRRKVTTSTESLDLDNGVYHSLALEF